MLDIVVSFLKAVLNTVVLEFLKAISDVFKNIFNGAFLIEESIGNNNGILTPSSVSAALRALYYIMVLLLTVKLIWKGIKVYVLWRDGESENSPMEMVVGALYALGVAIAFPVVYRLAIQIVWLILDAVTHAFQFDTSFDPDGNVLGIAISFLANAAGEAVHIVIASVVFAIVLCFAVFKVLGYGAELFIYRLGVPLAVVGLVDSDGGVWKSYCQALFRQLATIMVQYLLMVTGVYLLTGSNSFMTLVYAITFEIVSFRAPRLMNQFLLPAGGGGGGKAYMLMTVARSFIGG